MLENIKINNDVNMQSSDIEVLNNLFNEVIKNSKDLNLYGFRGINIVDDDLLNSNSVGRMEERLILLPKNKTEKYIEKKEYDMIKSIIYHELCHIDLANKLPSLHALHKKSIESEDYIKCFTIIVYIEYLAQLKSLNYKTLDSIERFFMSINEKNWNFNDDYDCILFIKASPYIISRALDKKCIDKNYIQLIKDKELKKHILEIEDIILNLPTTNLTDNIRDLKKLEKYVSKYIKND